MFCHKDYISQQISSQILGVSSKWLRYLIKLMHSHSPSFKLGVLNMTICFDHSRRPPRVQQRAEAQKLKISQLSSFVPKFKQPTGKSHTVAVPRDEAHNPYQHYIKHHKQSIRYFRQHGQSFKKTHYILGFNPQRNKTIQMEFNETFQDQPAKIVTKHNKDSHLRLVFNKRHIRNRYDPQERPRTERITIDLGGNPEESLKNIFTVRPVKSSIRSNRASPKKAEPMVPRAVKTRQEGRAGTSSMKQRVLMDLTEKKIRPWSPIRNAFNKQSMLESTILQSNYPE